MEEMDSDDFVVFVGIIVQPLRGCELELMIFFDVQDFNRHAVNLLKT